MLRAGSDEFYILAADIGRLKCNTAITVTKVIPQDMYFKKKLVYIEVINGENFVSDQAPRIKELIEIYNPREVVIDANGLGIGLIDAMTLPSLNQKNGKLYPPYYTFNLDAHLPPGKSNVSDAPWPQLNAIIYGMKANASNDSDIHANLYAQLNNGTFSMLASERVIKQKLLSTKKGAGMTNYDIRKYLLPYEMTSRLVDELNNLRVKPTGTQNQLKIEQISSATPKDRVSSLEYGLWRVKYYEDELMRRKKRKISNSSKYAFFTPRGGRD